MDGDPIEFYSTWTKAILAIYAIVSLLIAWAIERDWHNATDEI